MTRGRYQDKNDWEQQGGKRVNPHHALEYQPAFATVAAILNAAGMSEKNIARKLGTSYTNFRKWKREHEDLKYSLKYSKELVETDLIATGIEAAKGYKVKDRITEYVVALDEEGNEEIVKDDSGRKLVKVKEIEKEVPRNERLLMFMVSSLDRQLGRNDFQNKQYIEKKSTEEHIHKLDTESIADQIDRLSGNLRKQIESRVVNSDVDLIESDES